MPKYKVADLFCGAGGLSTGFELAGFKTVLAIDSNKHAMATFHANHIHAQTILEDIRNMDLKTEVDEFRNDNPIDVVIGGPPCEGFSVQNTKTRNMENPKNVLFQQFVRFVNFIRPQCFVFENVPGILSMENGNLMNMIFESFQKIGYFIPQNGNGMRKYYVLNAADFGVPQNRKRIIIIGSRSNYSADEIDFTPTVKKPISVGEAISDLPRIPMGGGGSNVQDYTTEPKTAYQKFARTACGKSEKLYNHIATKSTEKIVERFQYIKPGENWKSIPRHLMRNYKQIDVTHSSIYRRLKSRDPSVTISNFRKMMLIHPSQNRLISVREAARIQSFPDSYIFQGTISFMQEQVGDAVPVLLAKKVATEVSKIL